MIFELVVFVNEIFLWFICCEILFENWCYYFVLVSKIMLCVLIDY